ncbi:hypothetical protein F5880DRAFT_1605585 [Lentinula raphanica]|nr:hypothetical protein F5880DRAFT_1605585 [Lentinula raphanica]
MPTNDMQQKGNKLVTVEGIEFICEDPPFSKNKPKSFTVNRNWTNESTIGRKLFGSTSNTIDFHHAKLKFDWTQVYITDLGSKYGTWTSSSGKLSAGKSVLLKDGSTIVFGADHDKTHQNPDAIRVKVKFLKTLKILQPVGKTTPNKPLDSLKVPAPAHPAGRSKTPETLKPPEDPHKHRRTVSLEAPKKDKPPLEHQKLVWRPGASTELQREIKVPWSETFRLGFGVDALTGESMTRTALTPFKVSGSPRPKQSKTYVNTLHWNDIKSLRDQYDMEIGGTINVAPTSVSMSTRISSFLSKNASASTVLIQYRVIGEFEPEFVPADAGLQHGLPQLSEDEFRERYGDYYLAGRQRGYGCRMVIVCRVNDKSKTDKVEVEAQTLVENFFKTGAAHSSAKSRSKNCSILHE